MIGWFPSNLSWMTIAVKRWYYWCLYLLPWQHQQSASVGGVWVALATGSCWIVANGRTSVGCSSLSAVCNRDEAQGLWAFRLCKKMDDNYESIVSGVDFIFEKSIYGIIHLNICVMNLYLLYGPNAVLTQCILLL